MSWESKLKFKIELIGTVSSQAQYSPSYQHHPFRMGATKRLRWKSIGYYRWRGFDR